MPLTIDAALDRLSRYSFQLGQVESRGEFFPTNDYTGLKEALAVLRGDADPAGRSAYAVYREFFREDIALHVYLTEQGFPHIQIQRRFGRDVAALDDTDIRDSLARFRKYGRPKLGSDQVFEVPGSGFDHDGNRIEEGNEGYVEEEDEGPEEVVRVTDPLVEETRGVTSAYRLHHVPIHAALRAVDPTVAAFYRASVMESTFPPSTLHDLITSSDDYAAEISQAIYYVTGSVQAPHTELSSVMPEFLFELLARVNRRVTVNAWNPEGDQIASMGRQFRGHLEKTLRGDGTSHGNPTIHQGWGHSFHRAHAIHHHGPSFQSMHSALYAGGMAFTGAEAFAVSDAMMMVE